MCVVNHRTLLLCNVWTYTMHGSAQAQICTCMDWQMQIHRAHGSACARIHNNKRNYGHTVDALLCCGVTGGGCRGG